MAPRWHHGGDGRGTTKTGQGGLGTPPPAGQKLAPGTNGTVAQWMLRGRRRREAQPQARRNGDCLAGGAARRTENLGTQSQPERAKGQIDEESKSKRRAIGGRERGREEEEEEAQ
ncbi:unnamed protein product [Prorocentrum cordatum]|uniref:Uncharacterized protein n=1 Tax=Prorocentrum cordatum TaxID=2364126 RepID=A0ABN9PN89_9DINO|nr:unnamed protein product [Polarella glacialis]